MGLLSEVMEHPFAYRLWQAPFAERKFAPVLARNDLGSARRVLDLGCGPGTNAHYFGRADYVGVDLNPRYVAYARRRCRGTFLVADATALPDLGGAFDFVLVNSLLHHVDDAGARHILARLAGLLTPDGRVHILDLVRPPAASVARLLARWDRGAFARPLATWRSLFGEQFRTEVFEPYRLGALGLALWEMVYFRGLR